MPELNQQQVAAWLKVALASGGPFYAWVLRKFGITDADYQMYANLAAYLLPPIIVAVWAWVSNKRSAQVAKVASFTPEQQKDALNSTTDAAKVLIAKAVPGVATVVVKDTAGNGLAKLAASPEQPDIVTETQNAKDVKSGVRA